MSRTVFSALSGMRLLACLIVAPQQGYDEPAIISYAISPFCPTGADGLHFVTICSAPNRPFAIAILIARLDSLTSPGSEKAGQVITNEDSSPSTRAKKSEAYKSATKLPSAHTDVRHRRVPLLSQTVSTDASDTEC